MRHSFLLVLALVVMLCLAQSTHAAPRPISRLARGEKGEWSAPSLPSSASAPAPTSPPVLLSIAGCARQYLNWTIDCGGGETLTLRLANFTWVDSITIVSPRTGQQYSCANVRPIDLLSVSCTAPRVLSNEMGELLWMIVHDEVSNLNSARTYSLAYNRTSNRTE